MGKLTIRIPDDLHTELTILQQEDKLEHLKAGNKEPIPSINDLVVNYLTDYVAARKSSK